MKFIADLHIHSKYSRATSKNMVLEEIDRVADEKGILVMGTGDFTHPKWLKEIQEKLEPAEVGLFRLKKEFKIPTIKGNFSQTRFILSVEISSIYKQGEKVRRIHNIVFAPSIKSAEEINKNLTLLGCNLKSDGRPIIGLSSEKLAEIVFNIDKQAVIIPAHVWTPWFSIFGSMSGFDSIKECFGKCADRIFALETGLSSDPEMNWRLSTLDKVALISNSDSHSLQKIGREANIFDAELSYKGIMEAIENGAPIYRGSTSIDASAGKGLLATLEFFPEEGKYHYDGHRECKVVLSPKETREKKGICPVCRQPLTIGVMNRVEKLADRSVKVETKGNYKKFNSFVPYYNLIQLDEIISGVFGVGVLSKKVKAEYNKLIRKFGSEIEILMNVGEKELKGKTDEGVIEGIKRMREGKININPGYDGEYGVIRINSK